MPKEWLLIFTSRLVDKALVMVPGEIVSLGNRRNLAVSKDKRSLIRLERGIVS